MKTGIELIIKEREEQVVKHGYTINEDKKYTNGELIYFVEFLLKNKNDSEKDNIKDILIEMGFNSVYLHNMGMKSEKKRLTIAGALIAAEIDRIQNRKI